MADNITDLRRLTVKDVAGLLQLDIQTVYMWARLGRLPCIRIGRSLRFNYDDIKRWEEKQTTGKL